jgi:hypothetical protein
VPPSLEKNVAPAPAGPGTARAAALACHPLWCPQIMMVGLPVWFTRREDFKYFTTLRQGGERTFFDFSVKNFFTAPK